jgi:ankyrin repeat protein
MRTLRAALIAIVLASTAAPALAGKRPALVVAVDKGDAKAMARLLKKAKKKDLDAFDADARSPTAGLRAIEVAARKADAAAVDALLTAGAAATAKALELAASGGQLAIALRLLEAGAPRADLALTAAARAGHVDVVRALLPAARKADPYFNLDQVLEFAVHFPPKPSAAVVDALLAEKANPALQWGPGKQTVLHLAVAKGAADVVAVLLAKGAPVDSEDGDGSTPLLVALRGAQLEIARALLAAGADPRRVSKRGETSLSVLIPLDPAQPATGELFDRLLATQVPVDHAGATGTTALMVAAAAGSKPWIEKLLARGASIAAQNADGKRAIDLALTCAVGSGTWAPSTVSACHGEAALALLARPKAPVGSADGFARTPLARAAMSGSAALVERMLALGARDGAVDRWGNNPLHYAARFGTPAMVAALAAAKLADVNDPNDRDETPLAIARAAGKPDVERALVAAGAK